jgi:hypothetical protein
MSNGVFLRQNPQRWRKLPASTQMDLIVARERVATIREQISSTSLVRSMPLVEIHDVAWVSEDLVGITAAKSEPIKIGTITHFAALISGPAAIFASDTALRGILLHEFSHCFNKLRRIHRHFKSSTEPFSSPRPANTSEAEWDRWDREMLERPEDWFSPEDCAIFPYHHSSLTQDCVNTIFTEWVVKGLPVDTKKKPYDLGTVWMETEDDVEERIKKLESAS